MQDSSTEYIKPPTSLPEVQKNAIEVFGKTQDPFEAAFILSDGSLLYRRNSDEIALSHFEITKTLLPNSEKCESDFVDSGAIRISKYYPSLDGEKDRVNFYAELSKYPTPEQITMLKSLIQNVQKVDFDWFKPGINRHFFEEYSEHHFNEEHIGPDHSRALTHFLQKVRRSLAMQKGSTS